MPHWGEEYELIPSERQKREARLFIDAGADAVIGGHPHVVQPAETYNGKTIFYSLGNFVFDQYFSEETMKGIAIRLELKEAGGGFAPSYEIIPIQSNILSQPFKMAAETAIPFIETFALNSSVSRVQADEISFSKDNSLKPLKNGAIFGIIPRNRKVAQIKAKTGI
jgi:poly-gamma-glutamate synthesis protein (capsule biosynthesis protein)